MSIIFCIKQIQYNENLVSTVDRDGLALQHQAISSHGDEYAPMSFRYLRVNHQTNSPPYMVCSLHPMSLQRNPPDGRWSRNHTAWHLHFSVSGYWKVSRLDESLLVLTAGSEAHGSPDNNNNTMQRVWNCCVLCHTPVNSLAPGRF